MSVLLKFQVEKRNILYMAQFQTLEISKIIHSWDGISQHSNMSMFSTESESKTAITALKIPKVYHIFALYL